MWYIVARKRLPTPLPSLIRWDELFAGLKAIDYPGVFLFEDGRGENPDEWTKLAAEFPTNLAAKYAG